MPTPSSPFELLHFSSAMQWMRQSVQTFTSLMKPPLAALERAYKISGKRTKHSIQRMTMSQIGWSEHDEAAFQACKIALGERVVLAHRDHCKRLCIYVDASDLSWAGIVSQIPYCDIHLPHSDQAHEPFFFLSGNFNATQSRWSTIEKEAYVIMATVERIHWLTSEPQGFDYHIIMIHI